MEALQLHRVHVAADGVLKAIGECASRLMAGPQVAHPFHRLTNGAKHNTHGKAGLLREMTELLELHLRKDLGAAKGQRQAIVRDVGDGAHQVIRRSESGHPAIRIDERPILHVRVGIANQHVEHQPLRELDDGGLT